MTRINSRHLAMETLFQLAKSRKPLPILFDAICSRLQPETQDRAFAMNLLYGVLRQRDFLDLIITRLSKTPLEKLHPYVYQGLLVGLYQIFFLDRTPNSAAVNETVNGIKKGGPLRLAGFVNGILREALRQKDALPHPEDIYSMQPALLNHPHWMTSRWQHQYGVAETTAICRYNNKQPPLTLRVNSSKVKTEDYIHLLQEHNITAHQGKWLNEAVLLPDFQGQIQNLPGYEDALFQVQGEAAQLATLLLGPPLTEGRYLDACAGLGGKTFHLLELLTETKSKLVAVEPEPHRRALLAAQLSTRFGSKDSIRYTLIEKNLETFLATTPPPFQRILLDAPCSGTGVVARQPDIRWQRTLRDITFYAKRQQALLQCAAQLLLPEGVLVYATCSLEREEDQDIIENFLKKNPEFYLDDAQLQLPQSARNLVRDGYFAPRPSDGLDGFFAARLVRR